MALNYWRNMKRREQLAAMPVDPDAELYAAARLAAMKRPAYRERTDGRSHDRTHVCPAKMFAHHPDAALRELARQQSHEAHEAHGPCENKARLPMSQFQKNDHTNRIAVGMVRQARINARGW
jgi:hypothetical protein